MDPEVPTGDMWIRQLRLFGIGLDLFICIFCFAWDFLVVVFKFKAHSLFFIQGIPEG